MTVLCVCMHTLYLGSTSPNEKKKKKEQKIWIKLKKKLNYWLYWQIIGYIRQYGCQSKHLKYRNTLFHWPINISLYDTCWSRFWTLFPDTFLHYYMYFAQLDVHLLVLIPCSKWDSKGYTKVHMGTSMECGFQTCHFSFSHWGWNPCSKPFPWKLEFQWWWKSDRPHLLVSFTFLVPCSSPKQ